MVTKVMLVDDSPERSAWLEESLQVAGFTVVATVQGEDDLYQRVLDEEPEVVITEAGSGKRDTLEGLCSRGGRYPGPVMNGSVHHDPELMSTAAAAGLSAYAVGGVPREGVQGAIRLAIRQYERFQGLARELADTRRQLAEQRDVHQAKCLLMEREGLGEADAYHLLRRRAMNSGQPIPRLARRLLADAGLAHG